MVILLASLLVEERFLLLQIRRDCWICLISCLGLRMYSLLKQVECIAYIIFHFKVFVGSYDFISWFIHVELPFVLTVMNEASWSVTVGHGKTSWFPTISVMLVMIWSIKVASFLVGFSITYLYSYSVTMPYTQSKCYHFVSSCLSWCLP